MWTLACWLPTYSTSAVITVPDSPSLDLRDLLQRLEARIGAR
jgi:hypothetical protein